MVIVFCFPLIPSLCLPKDGETREDDKVKRSANVREKEESKRSKGEMERKKTGDEA